MCGTANDNKPTLWTVATALKYSMSSSAKTGAAAPKYLNTHPDLLTQTLKVRMASFPRPLTTHT